MARLGINIDIVQTGKGALQDVAQGLVQIQGAMDKINPYAMTRAGNEIASVGRTITAVGAGIEAAFVGIGYSSTKMAAEYETATTKIINLAGVSQDQMAGWSKDLLAMAPQVGKGPRELADALYLVTSVGIRTSEAMEIVRYSAQASAVGMGNTATIAQVLTGAISAYGSANLTAKDAANILTKTVREGGAEADRMAGSMGRILPIASLMGVSFKEVGAYMATFTRLGVSADIASSGLRATLSNLLAPQKQTIEALKKVGLTIQEVRDSIRDKGLSATLIDLMQKFDGNDEAIRRLLPNIRGFTGTLAVARNQAEAYKDIIGKISDNTDALGDAFEKVKQTTQFQWDQLKAQIEVVGIKLGAVLIPVLLNVLHAMQPLIDKAIEFIDWYSKLSPTVQAFGVIAVAAIGPVIMVVGTLITIVGRLVSTLGLLSALGIDLAAVGGGITTWLGGTGTAAAATTVEVESLAGAIGGGAAGIGAGGVGLMAAVSLLMGMELGNWLLRSGDAARGLNDPLTKATENVNLFAGAWMLFKDLSGWLVGLLGEIAGGIIKIGSAIGSGLLTAAGQLKDAFIKNDSAMTNSSSVMGAYASGWEILGHYLYDYKQPANQAAQATNDLAKASFVAGRNVTDWGEAIRILASDLAAHKAAMDAAARAQADADRLAQEHKKHLEELTKAQQKMVDGFTGVDVNNKMQELTEVYLKHRGAIEAFDPGYRKLIDNVQKLAEEGAKVPPVFQAIIDRMGQMVGPAEPLGNMLDRLTSGEKGTISGGRSGGGLFDLFSPKGPGGEDLRKQLVPGNLDFLNTPKEMLPANDQKSKSVNWVTIAKGLQDAYAAAGGDPNSTVGRLLTGFQGSARLGGEFSKSLKRDGNGKVSGVSDWGAMVASGLGGLADIYGATNQRTQGQRVLGGGLQGAATGAMFGQAFGPLGAAIGGGAGAVIGIFAGLIRHPEWTKVAEDLGRQLGKGISDGVAKAIAADEKNGIGRSIAEAMHAGDILAEVGVSGGSMSLIDNLMAQWKFGAIDTKTALDQLGKAFNQLKTAADGGDVASEAAMIHLIHNAKVLGETIPEIDAYVQERITDAGEQLQKILSAQAVGAGGSAQGAANNILFNAAFTGMIAKSGLATAFKNEGPAIAEMIRSHPGSTLTGAAGDAAKLMPLMTDEKFADFKKAAEGSEATAAYTKDMLDTDNLNQSTLSAIETTGRTFYDQAYNTALQTLSTADAQKAAEEAMLPTLTQMQHAQELGLKLSPDMQAMLTQASLDGLLPAKTLQETGNDYLKDIREGIWKLAGLVDGSKPAENPTGPADDNQNNGQDHPHQTGDPGGHPTGPPTGTPHAASGLLVQPRRGGTNVNVAEAGRAEVIAPVSAVLREVGAGLAAQMASSGIGGGGGFSGSNGDVYLVVNIQLPMGPMITVQEKLQKAGALRTLPSQVVNFG